MSRRVYLLLLFAQVTACASAALAIITSADDRKVDLIPPMVCERGAVPECWTVPGR